MKRKKIKTILCHMAIITICAGVFCHGYINGLSISKYDMFHSFAEADNWSSCDTSDLVIAFRYYCKSRNLAIEGSVADALTSFTTTTFNNICSTLGIDPTQLQAELKKTTAGNLGLRFLFSQTGITAYNRIFSEFLQNNDLSVGDDVDNKVLDNYKYYTDSNGNQCIIYVVDTTVSSGTLPNSHIIQKGTLLYSGDYFYSLFNSGTTTFNYDNQIYYLSNASSDVNYPQIRFGNSSFTSSVYGYYNASGNRHFPYFESGVTIFKISNVEKLYFGAVNYYTRTSDNATFYSFRGYNPLSDDNGEEENGTVSLTTNNKTINNNTYNNNYTIIYNDGDTYISDDDDEPGPDTPPAGDPGGGGDDPGDEPNNWNPTTPTIPSPSSPSFPTVELPDLDIPDLPSLNFSLGDLRNKFPFSLPFDIIAVLNVLDGEPQAPHIEATVPIGRWYTWEIDFDFSEFDNYARIFRAFEFIGFCIGLAVFTVHFVKG